MRGRKNNEVVKKARGVKGDGEKEGVAVTFETKLGVAISFLIFWGMARKSWRKKKTNALFPRLARIPGWGLSD